MQSKATAVLRVAIKEALMRQHYRFFKERRPLRTTETFSIPIPLPATRTVPVLIVPVDTTDIEFRRIARIVLAYAGESPSN